MSSLTGVYTGTAAPALNARGECSWARSQAQNTQSEAYEPAVGAGAGVADGVLGLFSFDGEAGLDSFAVPVESDLDSSLASA